MVEDPLKNNAQTKPHMQQNTMRRCCIYANHKITPPARQSVWREPVVFFSISALAYPSTQ